MKLLKTKFYPVDAANHIIHLEPFDYERDLAYKWGRNGKSCIGLTGAHLMAHGCYHAYRRVPTTTQATLLADWEQQAEESRSSPLWQGTAITICNIIRTMAPTEALAAMKGRLKDSRHMAISSYYDRAVRELKDLLLQQAQAT